MTKFTRGKKIDFFVGVDPGQTGAIAVIDEIQNIILLKDWPGNEIAAAKIIKGLLDSHIDLSIKAAIEKVHSMPGQGVASSFKFGTNYGIWKGIMASFQIPFHEPTPQAWQKGVLKKAQDKKPAIAVASRIFPAATLTGPRGGGKDGRADSLLIADWCRRQYL